MPELVLTTDEQLWDVLDPLLDKLDNTVVKKFPDEAIAADRLNAAKKGQTNAEIQQKLVTTASLNVNDLHYQQQQHAEVTATLDYYKTQLLDSQTHEQACATEITNLKAEVSLLKETDTEKKEVLTQSLNTAKKQYLLAKESIKKNKANIFATKTEVDQQAQKVAASKQLAEKSLVAAGMASECDGDQLDKTSLVTALKTKTTTLEDTAKKGVVAAKALVNSEIKEVADLKAKYASNRQNIQEAIKKVRTQKGFDYVDLGPELKKLAKLTPGIYGQTVQDFNTACDSAEHLKEVVAVRKNLTDKYSKKLNSPGDKHSATIEVEVGVGLTAAGLADIRATVIVGMEIEVKKESNGKLTASRKGISKIKIRARAGVQITPEVEAKIRAGVEGGISLKKSTTYGSMDDFISEESNNYMVAVVAGCGGKSKRKYIAETDKLLTEANNNITQLEQRLTLFGALDKKKRLKLTKQTHIDKVVSTNVTAAYEASASAVAKVGMAGAGIGLGGGASKAIITAYRSISYLDDITEQPVLQKIYAIKNPKTMGYFSIDSENNVKFLKQEAAINELDRIEKDIIRLKAESGDDAKINLKSHQIKLLKSLKLLQQEYDSYVTLQNYIDHDNTGGDACRLITEFKKRRGAKNTAEYVKSMAVQFATLRGLYEESYDSPDDVPVAGKNLSTSFAESLKVPRMKMTNSAIESAFGVDATTKATVINTFNGFFSIDVKGMGDKTSNKTRGGIMFKVAASFEEKNIPDRPVEENIKLKFNTTLGVKGDNYITQLFQIADLTKRFKDDGADIKKDLAAVFANVADGCVEIDFTKRNGHWVLKTAKGYDEQDRKIGAKLSVGSDIQLIAGITFKSKDKRLRNVYFGSKTLVALTDLYRAKHFGDAANDTNWDKFRQDSDLLKKMVTRLKAENSDNQDNVKKRLTNDMYEWLGELRSSDDPEDNEVANKFQLVWNSGKGDDAELEKALSSLVKQKVKIDDKAIADSFIKRRKFERHEVNEYAANVIADDMEKLVKEYKTEFNNENITDVPDLVDKARNAYNKKKNGRNFKLVKKAFAIEYASKELNELVRGGDAEDQNKAIAILGSDIHNILDSDKVYLNKRVEGRLIRKDGGNIEFQPIIRKGLQKVINGSEIKRVSHAKIGGLGAEYCKLSSIQMVDDHGVVSPWQSGSYEHIKHKGYQVRHTMSHLRLRSMKSGYKWKNKMSISDAISKVMQDRYKKQQKIKQAQKNKKRSSVSSASHNE